MQHIFRVGEITRALKDVIEGQFPFVWVRGQVSNLARPGSGHVYFSLKDEEAVLNVVWFKGSQDGLSLNQTERYDPLTGEVMDGPKGASWLTDGADVLCAGRLTVYAPRGAYQLVAELVQDMGLGRLYLEFEALKKKLTERGWFDSERKRPLPAEASRVAVITAPAAAAVRDFLRVAQARGTGCEIRIFPTLVQGDSAPGQIAEALDAAGSDGWAQAVVLIRGGGSIEDLWAFNSEMVAEAIVNCPVPVVCGVGHEVDVTIADMVADLRAATPTAAAELAVPDSRDILRHLATCQNRLTRSLRDQMTSCAQCLASASRSVVFRDPTWRLRSHAQRLDELSHRLRADLRHLLAAHRRRLEPLTGRLAGLHPAALAQRARGRLERLTGRLAWALGGRSKRAGEALSVLAGRLGSATPAHRIRLLRQHLDGAARQLESMSYRSVLQRGFSVTRGSDGEILRSALAARAGQQITTELIDGRIASRVEGDSAAAQAAPLPETPAAAPRKRRDKTTHTTGPSLFGPEGET